jgi:ribosomal protein L11 methylase PrmA
MNYLKIIIIAQDYTNFINSLEEDLIYNEYLAKSIIIDGVKGFEEKNGDILELSFSRWEIKVVLNDAVDNNNIQNIIIDTAKQYKIEILNLTEETDTTNYLLKNNVSETISLQKIIVFNKQQNFNKYRGKKIAILIEQSTAFGTGKHETTFMCLKFIESLEKLTNLKQINFALDVGTGSGILAIALAKIYPNITIIATDIDELALNKAGEFFIINKTSANITPLISNGFVNIVQKKNEIIFANILLEPLLFMNNDFYNNLTDNGFLVVSGFLKEQSLILMNHYKDNFKVIKKFTKNDWVAILLQKIYKI